jgi:hypothetical protein
MIAGRLGIKGINPAFILNIELLKIRAGTNPNPTLWSVILFVIIIQIIALIFIIKRYWKGVKT